MNLSAHLLEELSEKHSGKLSEKHSKELSEKRYDKKCWKAFEVTFRKVLWIAFW